MFAFFPSPSDEMKRRRDFYAAHPSADGKYFLGERHFSWGKNLTVH